MNPERTVRQVDWNQTKKFVRGLLQSNPLEGLFLEVRCIPRKGAGGKPRQFWLTRGSKAERAEVQRLNDSGHGVYLGPNPRCRTRGRREDVTEVRALYADLDVQSQQHPAAKHLTKRAAFLALADRLPQALFPSAVVDTGYGLQAHWFLRDPLPVSNGAGGQVEDVLGRLAAILDGDPGTEVNRVVRLPGSWNVKDPAQPRRVRLIHLAPDHRFTLEDFAPILSNGVLKVSMQAEVGPQAEPDWVLDLLRGVPQGTRHEAGKRLAGHFLGKGTSFEQTVEILRGWALKCNPPWAEEGADRELIEIVKWAAAQEAKKFEPPPGWESDDVTMQNYVDGIRAAKSAVFLRKRSIATCITTDLRARGRFLRPPEGPQYFRRDRRRVLDLVMGGDGLAGVLERFGLNPTEAEYRYVVEHLRTETLERGEPCEIRRLAHYDKDAKILHLSQFDGQVLRLDGQEITPTENGEGGVFFKDEPSWRPWQFDRAVQPGVFDQLLVAPVNFTGGFVGANDARCLWALWIRGLFFAEWMQTKPLCLLVGPKGSGKTSAFRALLVALFGPGTDVVALEGGQRGEEAFIAAVTASRLAAFDNADAKIPWLDDHLARLATGTDIVRRQLYTTNALVRYRPTLFIGLTARTPRFRREDVAERTLVLPLTELRQKISERALIDQVLTERDALWGDLVQDLNQTVARMRTERRPLRTTFRVADFVEFCRRAVKDQAQGQVAAQALRRMEMQQADFALAEEPLFAALEEWVAKSPERGPVDATTLNTELRGLAEAQGEKWPYQNGQRLGTRLRDLQGALGRFLRVTRQEQRGKKRVLWGFAPLQTDREYFAE